MEEAVRAHRTTIHPSKAAGHVTLLCQESQSQDAETANEPRLRSVTRAFAHAWRFPCVSVYWIRNLRRSYRHRSFADKGEKHGDDRSVWSRLYGLSGLRRWPDKPY